ncbi:hypothetical protein GGR56DRAFT_208991 [Xylariaceae sp. FL0804]|nr:hypothetical protein GGR56DRAFT_208991 [Xylariaceae sp. FL0804]
MAQKTGDSDDQPNPSSSSTKDSPVSGTSQKHSTSHTPGPAPTSQPSARSASDSKESGENAADANAMSKSTLAGSTPSSKDAMTGPSPYGTRSRNRGQARPNYAEDRDVDVDMEDAYPEKKEDEPKKSSRQANAATNGTTDAPKAAQSTLRKSAALDDAKTSNPPATAKDAHATNPGLSNGVGASTSSGHPKKRKAAAQSTTSALQANASAPMPATSAATGTRRGAANVAARTNAGYKETNMLSFESSRAVPKDGKLVADDGTELQANDHVYLICEPPGEPYYLARIMEFLHMRNDSSMPVEALRINWYYRPKDIGKKANDTRMVFASMHSDINPLTSLRGKCQIRHKAEIDDFDAYRKTPDSFWFEKLYDRYIQKNYDIIPCFQIVNVPERVKRVLDERWKYILVEQGRGKEFTSAVKSCKRCSGYCASNDSVDCAVCKQTYHMNCVRPPLLKKPSRGFAWACAACSRAQERRLEARHTPSLIDSNPDVEEEEYWDEEEEAAANTNGTSPADRIDDSHEPATAEQIYHASLWPYRYLGQHCKPEDALDYDDRIYPRVGSRMGPKYQATVLPWPGRPVELEKPLETKRGGKKEGKLSKEAVTALEKQRLRRENRPPWVQDAPPGYVARGEDLDNNDPENTGQLLWKPPPESEPSMTSNKLDSYVADAKKVTIPAFELPKRSTNVLDVATNTLFKNDFDPDEALRELGDIKDKRVFKEPDLSQSELKKFEEAVTKYGSELWNVTKHVKMKHSRTVRFYYTWKKTERGKQIWGNFAGRKGKKEAKKAETNATKLQDDVADDHDDSAFDANKASERKRSFVCKFCSTKSSRQWRRAPSIASVVSEGGGKNANKDKNVQYIVALCRRCAELWRRYAIQWEDVEDLARKVAAAGARSWRRKIDEELLKELIAGNEMMNMTVYKTPTIAEPPAQSATPTPATQAQPTVAEPPPRKKLKTLADREAERNSPDTGAATTSAQKKKEKAVEKPAPPPVPELPKPRVLPCAICNQMNPTGEQAHLRCEKCRLTVHRACYGVLDNRHPAKWTCDTCLNDKNPQLSVEYKCVLCPVEFTEHDFVEPPKNTHKKKTEKEREKERLDRELSQKAALFYRKRQEELGRPLDPREPLKRTADNNWVHVTCAVWTPEIKFANAKGLEPSEGILSIPRSRYEDICKACKKKGGACVTCHHCRASVHVECAHKHGYLLGFEITPVKGSRRDQHQIVTVGGETGVMSAAIWCKEHVPQRVHRMHDIVNIPDGQGADPNALQLYVQNFKQADLTYTGTVRKAALANLVNKTAAAALPSAPNRRHSTATATCSAVNGANSDTASVVPQSGERVCITCGIDVSPKWWPIDESQEKVLTNGYSGNLGNEAQRFITQRSFQCHKCRKANKQPVPHEPPPVEELPVEALPVEALPVEALPVEALPVEALPVEAPTETPPAIESLRPPPIVTPASIAATSPPPLALHAAERSVDLGSPWGPRPSAMQSSRPSVLPPSPAPPLQAPPGGPPPMPLATPLPGPSPMAAPGPPPPVATHHYPPPGTMYSEWPRNPVQTPMHQMSSSSGGPNTVHHNHLRDLRPPPIGAIAHHQPGAMPHSLGQPMVNGIPPPSSPRRGSASMHGSAAPYLPAYHHSTHHPLSNLTNGGPPPRASEHSFSQGLLSQRSPFTTPHGSPPISREGVSMSREASLNINPPPRPSDGRPASGASASPSLRNLLS